MLCCSYETRTEVARPSCVLEQHLLQDTHYEVSVYIIQFPSWDIAYTSMCYAETVTIALTAS